MPEDAAPTASSPLRERLAWHALQYGIPRVANRLPYMLGGLTFATLVLLTGTGIILDQFYQPNPTGAHESIIYTMTRVRLGNWLRALHYWGAGVLVILAVCHLVYVFWRRSYFRPRELTWWSGTTLLLLVFGLVFTGTVLRGDQEGGEALAHALAGAELVGAAGRWLAPDFAPSTTLLARMHNAHVSLLPLLLFGLIALHFWLIRHLGIHAHGPPAARFSQHVRRLGGYALLLCAALGAVAALWPPGLGYPLVEGVEVTKPFWPFLWVYAAENTVGLWGMLIAPVALFGFLYLVPILDRRHDDRGGRPFWLFALGTLLLALYLGALLYGAFAPQMQHLGM